MGNCLVTKLKEVVQNDNLRELGTIKIEANASRQFVLTLMGQGTVIESNVPFVVAETQETTSSYTLPTEYSRSLTFASGLQTIRIKNKYLLVSFSLNAGGDAIDVSLNAEDFAYLTSLYSFKVRKCPISEEFNFNGFNSLGIFNIYQTGCRIDLAEVAKLTTSTEINLNDNVVFGDVSLLSSLVQLNSLELSYNPNIVGNISALAPLINLTSLGISSTSVEGSVKNFIEQQIHTYGRTSGKLVLMTSNNRVVQDFPSFNLVVIYNNGTAVVKSYDETQTFATYDGTSWS